MYKCITVYISLGGYTAALGRSRMHQRGSGGVVRGGVHLLACCSDADKAPTDWPWLVGALPSTLNSEP